MRRRYLRSKILRPEPDPGWVLRPRLSELLETSTAALWLVSAPAGYGKTTLLSQLLDTVDGVVGWVSVDSLDNDPVRFWAHVGAALIHEDQALEELLDWLEPASVDGVVDALVGLVESQVRRVFLVLDDMHEIHSPAIVASLARILKHPPDNLTMVVATRADPALPIGRLRSLGRLQEIRAPDLAFNKPEAAELFGGQLEPTAVENIVSATEGWVTALRMLLVSSGPSRSADRLLRVASADQSDLADFLAGEVLVAQDDATQRFLLETSVLTDLDPALCDAVTGRPGSLSMLRRLAKAQVFTQLIDPETDTFRYHPLFRDFLRARANELGAGRSRALHSAAAHWFADRDRPTLAVTHAVQADDYELARDTVKRHYISYSEAGRVATINDWLGLYGLDRCRSDPDLRLMAAWVALNARCYGDIESWLEPLAGGGPAESDSFLAEAYTIRSNAARHLGDLESAMSHAERACRYVRDPDSAAASVAHAALGSALALAGRPGDASLVDAVNGGTTHNVDSSAVVGYSYLALAASEHSDQLESAEALADQALAYVTNPVLERFHQPGVALLVKSKVALARGFVGDAVELADRAEAVAEAASEPLVSVLVHCQQARIAHLHGSTKRVRGRLRLADKVLGDKGGAYLADVVRLTHNGTRFANADIRNPSTCVPDLTGRELAVLRLLPHGLARRELAAQLHVSENTLKSHLTSIRHKLGVSGETSQVVARARRLGLLPRG